MTFIFCKLTICTIAHPVLYHSRMTKFIFRIVVNNLHKCILAVRMTANAQMHIGSNSYSQYAFMQIVDYNTIPDKFCHSGMIEYWISFARSQWDRWYESACITDDYDSASLEWSRSSELQCSTLVARVSSIVICSACVCRQRHVRGEAIASWRRLPVVVGPGRALLPAAAAATARRAGTARRRASVNRDGTSLQRPSAAAAAVGDATGDHQNLSERLPATPISFQSRCRPAVRYDDICRSTIGHDRRLYRRFPDKMFPGQVILRICMYIMCVNTSSVG